MKNAILLSTTIAVLATYSMTATAAEGELRWITLDPGHFHAALVQKFMYPQVNPVVHVYAPEGPDVALHLKRIEGFNTRSENPTKWQEKVYAGKDFLERMIKERAGNVVVISGNNRKKTDYIYKTLDAGFNVFADKPMAITPQAFPLLRKAFERAAQKKVLLRDIMTERYEITAILLRELVNAPTVFGSLEKGTPQQPAVEMESVHYFFKEVAGKPLIRPPWFYDTRQQGEAIPDVGTHLVDLVQWQCFPDQTLDWKKDIKVLAAKRWPTTMTPAQFKLSTGLDKYPDYLKSDIGPDGALNVFQNGDVTWSIKGVHAKVAALWGFQAPPGTGDTHYQVVRGSKANVVIKQGKEQNYKVTVYVENKSGASADEFDRTLRAAVAQIAVKWAGVDMKKAGACWEIIIPEKYHVGHEAHFGQVAEKYLRYLGEGKMAAWEVPNMTAKYFVTTEAFRLSHAKK
ncbi:MAG: Gfo/Idh/MocA family oxidoreductase [Verrucomicrobia bacterium]|nr:Gfo/Idh/MocA family oxidoreductase [Verrucomicrobiota bacterium]